MRANAPPPSSLLQLPSGRRAVSASANRRVDGSRDLCDLLRAVDQPQQPLLPVALDQWRSLQMIRLQPPPHGCFIVIGAPRELAAAANVASALDRETRLNSWW